MFHSSAPARVCLYGEHQDYLQLNVIPAAIDLRLIIDSQINKSNMLSVYSHDFKKKITLSNNPNYLESEAGTLGSYLEAGILALKNLNSEITFPSLDVSISSQIPVASGLSSSAALLVSWIKHLDGILELKMNEQQIAEAAYDAEHKILKIPCGKMDQYSSSFGQIIRLTCTDPPELLKLVKPDIGIIIVDSQTPKLTSKVHTTKVKKIKKAVAQFEKIVNHPIKDSTIEILEKKINKLSIQEGKILRGVMSIKEDTEKAEKELTGNRPDLETLGMLLTSQHQALSENLSVSLKILDKIVETGISYGALGGKLTGAGLGGNVVLMTASRDERIARKIRNNINLPVRTVNFDKGVFFKIIDN